MPDFTLIDKDENIVGCGVAPNWAEQANNAAGERVILGKYPRDVYHIVNGSPEFLPDDVVEDAKRSRIIAANNQLRQSLLDGCLWTVAIDAPDNIDQAAWIKYRKALRDMGDEIRTGKAEIKWPEPPA